MPSAPDARSCRQSSSSARQLPAAARPSKAPGCAERRSGQTTRKAAVIRADSGRLAGRLRRTEQAARPIRGMPAPPGRRRSRIAQGDPARVGEPSRKPTPAGRAWVPSSGWFVQERGSRSRSGSGRAPGASFPGSETRRGVPRADQPSLGVVALGDDSGDAPADPSQRSPYALRHVVVHRSSSVFRPSVRRSPPSLAVRRCPAHWRKSLFSLLIGP